MAERLLDVHMLQALREARGWDQLQLAQQAGIDPSVVSRAERGLQDDFRLSALLKLARALNVPIDALLRAPTAPPPPLTPDLTAIITRLPELSPAQQRQVAALLDAYISTLPKE